MGNRTAFGTVRFGVKDRHQPELGGRAAADRLMRAIERVTRNSSLHTPDLGGAATTRAVTDAVITAIRGENL